MQCILIDYLLMIINCDLLGLQWLQLHLHHSGCDLLGRGDVRIECSGQNVLLRLTLKTLNIAILRDLLELMLLRLPLLCVDEKVLDLLLGRLNLLDGHGTVDLLGLSRL